MFFIRYILILFLMFQATGAHATSCSDMVTEHYLICQDGICSDGFQSYEVSTLKHCGRRSIVEDSDERWQNIWSQYYRNSQYAEQPGTYLFTGNYYSDDNIADYIEKNVERGVSRKSFLIERCLNKQLKASDMDQNADNMLVNCDSPEFLQKINYFHHLNIEKLSDSLVFEDLTAYRDAAVIESHKDIWRWILFEGIELGLAFLLLFVVIRTSRTGFNIITSAVKKQQRWRTVLKPILIQAAILAGLIAAFPTLGLIVYIYIVAFVIPACWLLMLAWALLGLAWRVTGSHNR